MSTLEFPTLSDCEPRWLDRPVSVIATHISRVYHEFTRDQLPVIADLAARVQSIGGSGWNESLPELVALLSQLRDAVETHAWSEDDFLFPVLVAHEYPEVLATSVGGDELLRLLEQLAAEHIGIRALIAEIEHITERFRATADTPSEYEDLVNLAKELTQWLNDELDLEDRCLLPRARLLALAAK
jgi:iron-sulfur cluster repair protein YtfE (RIC family)